jgi:hypothetical protein
MKTERMTMNASRLVHSLNCGLWLVQVAAWGFYAHSSFMALASGLGAGLSFYMARREA